eukprot:sb/3479283/
MIPCQNLGIGKNIYYMVPLTLSEQLNFIGCYLKYLPVDVIHQLNTHSSTITQLPVSAILESDRLHLGGRTLVLTDSLSKFKADSISKNGLFIYS